MSGRRDAAVEVDRPLLHRLHQVLRPDNVGAGLLRLLGTIAAGEDRHARRAARAVRQVGDAAHHLVGVARVDAEVERHLDRLVELGDRPLLHHLHGIGERIELLAVDPSWALR